MKEALWRDGVGQQRESHGGGGMEGICNWDKTNKKKKKNWASQGCQAYDPVAQWRIKKKVLLVNKKRVENGAGLG